MWWAFDIETEAWDTLVYAAAVSEDGRWLRTRSAAAIADWYKSLPPDDIVWAHNGGGFDFLFLISVTRELDWSGLGGSLIACRAEGHAECRDSLRLFMMGLSTWTRQKAKLDLPCSCAKACGGYCSIRRDMEPELFRRVADYCDQDCRALLTTLRADLERLSDEGMAVFNKRGLPRHTFGSIAWHTAAEMAGIHPTKTKPWGPAWADYNAGRRAYYGGRCEVGAVNAARGERYDVNAMYPWALTYSVPFGKRSSREKPSDAYRKGRHGCYRAVVDIPDTDLPLLPHRYNAARSKGRLHKGRMLWTTGRIVGWWTLLELQAAEDLGARIQQIVSACIWDNYEPLYAPYVQHIYGLRDDARSRGDDRWASILKWFANALSGKLAQHPTAVDIRVVPNDTHIPADQGWHRVGMDGRVWAKEILRAPAANSRPIEAAYLTSRARIKLLQRLVRHRGEWLYCDTDSTYLASADAADVDATRLGAWKAEGALSEWRCLAPKLYRYRDAGGASVVRARGIPNPEWDTLDELAAGRVIRREGGVLRVKSGGGDFVRRTIIRSHRDHNTDRCGTRFVESNGRTRPLHRRASGEYV